MTLPLHMLEINNVKIIEIHIYVFHIRLNRKCPPAF
jgi:hypothetical protein